MKIINEFYVTFNTQQSSTFHLFFKQQNGKIFMLVVVTSNVFNGI